MPVTAIAGTTQTQTTAPAAKTTAATATSNTTLDRQAFLKLLVAQLKYQDPSKPMDASAMISQSAQLSVVDKLDEISKALTSSGITDRLMLAGSVIGKQVTFAGSDGTPTSASVTSVRIVNGSMVLAAGEWDVPISAVTAIAPAPIASPPPPATVAASPAPIAPPPPPATVGAPISVQASPTDSTTQEIQP